jgi:hypothetical protein
MISMPIGDMIQILLDRNESLCLKLHQSRQRQDELSCDLGTLNRQISELEKLKPLVDENAGLKQELKIQEAQRNLAELRAEELRGWLDASKSKAKRKRK